MAIKYQNNAERISLARQIAAEGIILLKNECGMLPFGKEKIAVFGRTQVNTIKCGTGSAFCESEYCVNVLEGMENAGLDVDKTLAEKYRDWCAVNSVSGFGVWGTGSHINPEMPLSEEEIQNVASRTEKAVFVIGRTAGENDDSSAMDGDFRLSPMESELLENIKKYYNDILVIINSGNLINLTFTDCEQVKAVIMLNLPGMEGGNALGDILVGKVSPCAKLTDTIARRYKHYPASEYFGRKAGLIQNYYEDIFVGYRYFETFPDAKQNVLYPFGFGLSYTDFEKNVISFECGGIGGIVRVKVLVKNVGEKYAGKEVVMLYSSSPESALGAPKYELRAFEKTRLLAPGEEEMIELSFHVNDMASFDDTGALGRKDFWTLAAGKYSVYFGNNVAELALAGEWTNESTAYIKECIHIPTELEKRLTASGEYETLDAIEHDMSSGIQIGPMARLTVEADEYTEIKEKVSIYHLNVTTAGLYTLKLYADAVPQHAFINEHPLAAFESYFENGGAAIILSPGTNDFVFVGENKAPAVAFEFEKEDETVHVKAQGSSVLECGKFTECALYVIARQFEDEEGLIKHGRGLFRMHTPGRFAMYKLEVEKAGFYDFTIRYSTYHDDRALEDTYNFMVSNVTQDIEHVMLEKTTEEDAPFSFKTAKPIRLALPAGEAYLKVVSKTKHTPHLAYMEITPSTRDVYIAPKKEENTSEGELVLDEATPKGTCFQRKPLPEIASKYDFRNVLNGTLTMDEFVADLSDNELALLSCGNKIGQIGRISARGIPEAYWSDGPVGYRQNFTVTVYPSSTMLASSFNKELAYEFGKSIGCEGNLYNIDVWLAPAINIHRDPCCGRNFEYMSEDPYVSGIISAYVVNGVEEFDVSTTVKHFAANNTEYQRMKSNSRVSARALREIYMKAFEIAIELSQPMAIMTSYNHINGIKVSENPIFCNEILRKEFGFEGLIMSDFSNDSIHVKELAATQDLKMNFGDPKSVCEALANGTLSRQTVRDCIKRVLNLIMLTTVKNEKKK
ncbi:MAG: glycoside hydrolase family 3 C-terminal domain-containing protein [Clostridia bacterium]|nr:glycoside hydrolase family 3 C-terminal domain-containing protein [Clostridia bacterium]